MTPPKLSEESASRWVSWVQIFLSLYVVHHFHNASCHEVVSRVHSGNQQSAYVVSISVSPAKPTHWAICVVADV